MMQATTRLERRTGADRTATVDALRARLQQLQQQVPAASAPAPAALGELVPSLRVGAVHSIESRSLALACLAAAMPDGAWGAIVGMPDLGVEAAADLGVPIDRVALVPRPGRAWFDAVAHLAEAMPVVLAAAPGRVTPSDAARLAARLRQAESTLLVAGSWPGAATSIRRVSTEWQGLEAGDGRIVDGWVVVEAVAAGRARLARVPIARATPAERRDALVGELPASSRGMLQASRGEGLVA